MRNLSDRERIFPRETIRFVDIAGKRFAVMAASDDDAVSVAEYMCDRGREDEDR